VIERSKVEDATGQVDEQILAFHGAMRALWLEIIRKRAGEAVPFSEIASGTGALPVSSTGGT
jgi:hypothetical protein